MERRLAAILSTDAAGFLGDCSAPATDILDALQDLVPLVAGLALDRGIQL